MDEKTMQEYIEDCNKAKSHLEAPLLGGIKTPICLSCINRIIPLGMVLSKCKIYGETPKDFLFGRSLDCPSYELIPNCPEHRLPNIND